MNINILVGDHIPIKDKGTAAAGITQEIQRLVYVIMTTDSENQEYDYSGKLHELINIVYHPIYQLYIVKYKS